MKKNKILIVSEVFYPEEFNINDVALSWKSKGYDVDVLTMVPSYPESTTFDGYKNKLYQKEEWQGINIFRVNRSAIKNLMILNFFFNKIYCFKQIFCFWNKACSDSPNRFIGDYDIFFVLNFT